MSRRELNCLIHQDLLFYHQTKPQLSGLFLNFIEEYSRVFTQSPEFQYILVPLSCHEEFQKYLENPKEKTIYEDPHHYHYIDPQMKPAFYRFCQVHDILSMCRKIQAYPPTRRLPTSLMIEEARRQQIPERYYQLLIECVEPSGLPFLLPVSTGKKAISIAHLMLKFSQRFPLFIGNAFITNWLVQQGCGRGVLDQMWNNGFPLQFPLRIETPQQKLCPIDEKIVEWCFQKSGTEYPFSTSVDHIIMNPSYQDALHFPLVSYSIRYGFTPSKTAFSVLLKKTNVASKDLVFKDYVIQQLKMRNFDADIWAETAWHTNQDEMIEWMLTFCDQEVMSYVVIHLCMNTMDILHADMDYWVLKLWQNFSRYMKFVHLVRFYRDQQVRMVDPRILKHLRQDPHSTTTTSPVSYPPFYERHPQMLVFTDNHGAQVEIPVYFSFLRSGLLLKISTATGFKPPSNPDKNVVQLDLGLPNIFHNQKKVMNDWIMFSYFHHIPHHCSTEDVIELYHLSQYLVDEECEKQSERWLDRQYMTHYETHMKHDKKQECLLCSFWHR